MAKGKGPAAKNKVSKGKPKAEPDPQPDIGGPTDYDAKKDQEAVDEWGNLAELGGWDVPDQPVSSPPPAPILLPPAPITDFPQVNPRLSQQKRGSQIPPTIAMQRGASANARGWGESGIPGFPALPDPNPAPVSHQEQQGFLPGMQHQPSPAMFMGGRGFPSPKVGGAPHQPAMNFESLGKNNLMTPPKISHGTGLGGMALGSFLRGGGGAASAMAPQNSHNTNSGFNNAGEPDDDRPPPMVPLGEKGRASSPINFLRAGLGIVGARATSPTQGKTLKAGKKLPQPPQHTPVQAWGVAGPDINLTSFTQAAENRQGTTDAWGGWEGGVEDEDDAWRGPATSHAAANNKWDLTQPAPGVSGWGPPSPAGPGRAVKWDDSAAAPPFASYIPPQDSPQQTAQTKGKKGGKKGKKNKMSNGSDDGHHNPVEGGLSSSWGQKHGRWGEDHGDGEADQWGTVGGGHHDRDGTWGANDDYGDHGRGPLPKVTVAAATRLSGGKPQAAFVDSGLDPKDVNPTVRIEGSNGKALEPALHALYGMHRVAEGRIIWTLPYGHDPRVVWMNDFIERFNYALASYGFHKYIRTREKGALIVNVDYADEKSPNDPAFDWLSFAESQKTRDRTVQRSIAASNPAITCVVFMFLLSKSGNSVGMWRRRIAVPEKLQNDYRSQIRGIESGLRDKVYTVKVDPPYSALPRSSDAAPALPGARDKKTKPLPAAAITTITAPSLFSPLSPLSPTKPKKEKKGNFITRWIRWGPDDSTKIKKKKKEPAYA